MREPTCKHCRHYEMNHVGGECQIAGCECIYYEPKHDAALAASRAGTFRPESPSNPPNLPEREDPLKGDHGE